MKPTLYLMLGYPGAGKTTTAEIVAQLTGAVHLASDKIRLQMFADPQFTLEEHEALYKAIDQQTKDLLTQGKSVIYDANLNRYQHRKEKYDICDQTGAKPVLLWVQVPVEVAKQRATRDDRHHLVPKDESPEAMFDRIAHIIEPPRPTEKPIFVDGTKVTPGYIKSLLSATLV